MDYEIEILREIVKQIEEVCGKLHPDGYYTVAYYINSNKYSFGYTVYAYVDNRLERIGGRVYTPTTTWGDVLCMHLVRPPEEIISSYDIIVVKIYERVLSEVTRKIEVYRTDKENNELIYIPSWKAPELYKRVKALLP